MLLHYFGEKNEHHCGQCDICLQKHTTGLKQGEFQDLKEEILKTLSSSPCTVSELASRLNMEKEKMDPIVSFLVSEEIIHSKDGILS